MPVMIRTENLTRHYGDTIALANLNLEIDAGDCFGVSGGGVVWVDPRSPA